VTFVLFFAIQSRAGKNLTGAPSILLIAIISVGWYTILPIIRGIMADVA